jgi:hypothetical protein
MRLTRRQKIVAIAAGVLILLVLLPNPLFQIVRYFGPYRGEVVDAATGKPLAGAEVIAVYQFFNAGPGGAVHGYLGNQAVRTGPDGRFEIPMRLFLHPVVFGGFEPRPYLNIYLSGYGNYPGILSLPEGEKLVSWGRRSTLANGQIPSWTRFTVRLPRLTRREELDPAAVYFGTIHKIPRQERERLEERGFHLGYAHF